MSSRAKVYVPQSPLIDWAAVAADERRSLVITNRPSEALRLCQAGQPAVVVIGVSQRAVAKWLRKRGSRVFEKVEAN